MCAVLRAVGAASEAPERGGGGGAGEGYKGARWATVDDGGQRLEGAGRGNISDCLLRAAHNLCNLLHKTHTPATRCVLVACHAVLGVRACSQMHISCSCGTLTMREGHTPHPRQGTLLTTEPQMIAHMMSATHPEDETSNAAVRPTGNPSDARRAAVPLKVVVMGRAEGSHPSKRARGYEPPRESVGAPPFRAPRF